MRAKMAQEYYAAAFFASKGLDSASLRYFNVFGPRQDPNSEYAAVIPKFITLMLAGRQPTIFGDGTQTRDFIYVENVVAANLAAALHPERLRGAAINIACGVRTDLNQLVAGINSELGTNINAAHAAARPGEILHSVADISRAKALLGFAPAVALGEGLAKTIDSFRRA